MELRRFQEKNTRCQTTQISDLSTTTSNVVSASDCAIDLKLALKNTEEAECGLSYLLACGTEQARKLSGSYYTPIDVASFFWNDFFSIGEINTLQDATDLIQRHRFVEPSAGAGVLVFSLLHKLASMGMATETLASMDLQIVDVNKRALVFIDKQFRQLSTQWDVKFPNLKLVCSDFRKICFNDSDKPLVFFGNPPFVKNVKGSSTWKNLFADFTEIALKQAGRSGSVHFIVPLSLAFSRDFKKLREMLFEHDRAITLSHFDNIPDTLFKSGKPLHTNTNKANSQRCSIVTVRPAEKTSVFSSKLLRWSKHDRADVLSRTPVYHDVGPYSFDGQIPRPENSRVLKYLNQDVANFRLGDLCSNNGKYILHVGSVARNYIGIREEYSSGVHQLRFDKKKEFYRALLILGSDLFFAYWRTVGDGFHVTKTNIHEFPIQETLNKVLDGKVSTTRKIWASRDSCRKSKLNSGRQTHSYDFSNQMPSLLSC
jgi:hypothetical protein